MAIFVTSEIAPLRKVLLHKPGRELEHLSPNTMEQLLFDDIPYLLGAQQEHDQFAAQLRALGSEVVYLEDLMAEVLTLFPDLRRPFIREVVVSGGDVSRGYCDMLIEYLAAIEDAKTLVETTMSGIAYQELFPRGGNGLSDLVGPMARFLMPPIPNLYFTRDPFACIGRGVSLNHMSSATRSRETIYGGYVLRHHPDYAGQVPLYYTPEQHFCIEGGDVLNLSASVLAVGLSQRTQPEAVELLAQNIFADEKSGVDTILAFDIPRTRAFMHLDTVFTQVDVNKFTVHPGILAELSVYELTGRHTGAVKVRHLRRPLEEILKTYLGLDSVQLIRCGGESEIAAQREQWNDGSNTLCIRPGVVMVYDRNYVTNQILEDSGVQVVKLPSSELSRGRGGPRCMSMPLVRDTL